MDANQELTELRQVAQTQAESIRKLRNVVTALQACIENDIEAHECWCESSNGRHTPECRSAIQLMRVFEQGAKKRT